MAAPDHSTRKVSLKKKTMLPELPASLIQQGVHFAHAQVSAELSYEEEAIAAHFKSKKRKHEFALGRTAARQAMEKCFNESFDMKSSSIGRGRLGVPIWPEGIVGSITHSNGTAVAAVWESSPPSFGQRVGLGIDLESLRKPRDPRIFRSVFTSREMGWISEACDENCRAVILFSGKEAVFKALFSIYNRAFDLRSIQFRVDCPLPRDDHTRRLIVELPALNSSGLVHFSASADFVFAASKITTAQAASFSSSPPEN